MNFQDSIFTLFLARMYAWQIIQFRNLLFRDFRLVEFKHILCFAGIANISHKYEYLELKVSIALATKCLRILSLVSTDKIRNQLVANQ